MTPENDDLQLACAEGDAAVIARLATASLVPQGVPTDQPSFVVVPPGHTVHSLEYLQPAPLRTKRQPVFQTAAAFVAYVNRFTQTPAGTPWTTAPLIYAHEDTGCMTAVLDHPTAASPAWGEHTPRFKVKLTREWQAWIAANGKRCDQVAFAEFIENHLPEIAEPAGADLLAMVKGLDIRKAVQFQSSVRLDNGQVQLTYIEDVTGTAAKGTATLYDTFVLGLAPFEGVPSYRLTARLRYRLESGKVVLWLDLLRPEDVVHDAWTHLVTQVADETGVAVLAGQP